MGEYAVKSDTKYQQISEEIRSRCQNMTIGVRLPAERQLADDFSVSVMTVRHALQVLADEGWVRRSAGSGTFVSRPTVSMGPSLTSFTQDMMRRGFRPSSQVLRAEVILPDIDTVMRLGLRPGEKVFLVERLRSADKEPMCHEIGLFPEQLGTFLYKVGMEGSLHEILSTHGVVPRATERSVRAVVAMDRECALLDLPPKSPALEIVDLFSDAASRPIHYVRSRYRFDRYEVLANIETREGTHSPDFDPGAALAGKADEARERKRHDFFGEVRFKSIVSDTAPAKNYVQS